MCKACILITFLHRGRKKEKDMNYFRCQINCSLRNNIFPGHITAYTEQKVTSSPFYLFKNLAQSHVHSLIESKVSGYFLSIDFKAIPIFKRKCVQNVIFPLQCYNKNLLWFILHQKLLYFQHKRRSYKNTDYEILKPVQICEKIYGQTKSFAACEM